MESKLFEIANRVVSDYLNENTDTTLDLAIPGIEEKIKDEAKEYYLSSGIKELNFDMILEGDTLSLIPEDLKTGLLLYGIDDINPSALRIEGSRQCYVTLDHIYSYSEDEGFEVELLPELN